MPSAIIQPERTSMPIEIPNILKVNELFGGLGLFMYNDNSLCFGYLDAGTPYTYSPRLSVYELEQYCYDHYLKFIDISSLVTPKFQKNTYIQLVPFWESYEYIKWIYNDAFKHASFIVLQQAFDLVNALNDSNVKLTFMIKDGHVEVQLSTWQEHAPQELIPLPFYVKFSNTEYLTTCVWNIDTPAVEYISPIRKSIFMFFGFTAIQTGLSLFAAKNHIEMNHFIDYFINGFSKSHTHISTLKVS